jgi:Helix-turn-helix domain
MAVMNLARAAVEIGCSERWLADRVRAGRFPARKIGRRWMFADGDITAILEMCSVSPAVVPAETENSLDFESSMTATTRRRLRQNRHRP